MPRSPSRPLAAATAPDAPPPREAAAGAADVDALVRAARAGSREAFGRLVERFAAPLHAFLHVRGASREDAEELTQEAFLRAWRKLDTYRPTWRFSTWLFTVARRLAVSHHRAASRRPLNVELGGAGLDGAARTPEPVEDLADREQRGRLWDLARRELGEEQLSALWMRYAEDFPVEDIATVLDRRPATVRVWLFRARERLGRLLEPPGGADTAGSAPSAPAPADPGIQPGTGGAGQPAEPSA